MADDFYARWFSRTQPKPLTPAELWQRHTNYLRNLATSPLADELVQKFNVPEVEAAEEAFKAAAQKITDPELRNAIDMAAGKLTSAYQILGFCAGHFSTDSRARNF